jgi:protein O-mannosyl-transferase
VPSLPLHGKQGDSLRSKYWMGRKRRHGSSSERRKRTVGAQPQASSALAPGWADGARCVLILALCWTVYSAVRDFDFVNWDDPTYVLENPRVLAGLTWANVWWALTTAHSPYWHPLTWLSHMLDVTIWGPAPGPAHVVNLLIHALNSCLVYVVLRVATRAVWPSLVVAAVFAVHPLHVESVAWIAERKDVLSSFFILLTMLLYVWFVRKRTLVSYVFMLLCFAFALMSKPMAVTVPVLLLLLDIWPLQRLDWTAAPRQWARVIAEKLPMLVLALVTMAVTVLVQRDIGAMASLELLPWSARVTTALVGYVWYLRLIVWPTGLAAFHPLSAWPLSTVVMSVTAIVALTALAFRVRANRPHVLVGWLFFLIGLSPVIGLLQAGEQAVAERFVYLPLLGIVVAITWEAAAWLGSRKTLAAVAVCSVIAAEAVVARAQVPAWTDSLTLWTRTIEATGGSSRAYENLAQAQRERGDYAAALGNYRRALDLAPAGADRYRAIVWNGMGITEMRQGNGAAAVNLLRQAVQADGSLSEARLNFGNTLATQGQLHEAESQLRVALEQQPELVEANVGLGNVLLRQGRAPEAEQRYLEALELESGRAEIHNGLGAALLLQGELKEALTQLQMALSLNPGLATVHLNIGLVLMKQGSIPEARKEFEAALALDSSLTSARNALEALKEH